MKWLLFFSPNYADYPNVNEGGLVEWCMRKVVKVDTRFLCVMEPVLVEDLGSVVRRGSLRCKTMFRVTLFVDNTNTISHGNHSLASMCLPIRSLSLYKHLKHTHYLKYDI